jgi:hypothetical protein
MGIGTAGGGGAYLGEGGATFTKNVRGCCSGRIDEAVYFSTLPQLVSPGARRPLRLARAASPWPSDRLQPITTA